MGLSLTPRDHRLHPEHVPKRFTIGWLWCRFVSGVVQKRRCGSLRRWSGWGCPRTGGGWRCHRCFGRVNRCRCDSSDQVVPGHPIFLLIFKSYSFHSHRIFGVPYTCGVFLVQTGCLGSPSQPMWEHDFGSSSLSTMLCHFIRHDLERTSWCLKYDTIHGNFPRIGNCPPARVCMRHETR